MATLTYSAYKSGSYGAGASHSDPYFTYDGNVSYNGTIGQSTVTQITACKFTNANTNGSSSTGYKMEVQIMLNGTWCVIGYITASFTTTHTSWSAFTSTASASTKSLMGKYPPGGARLKVVNGYFHLNAGSTLSVTATTELDYATSTLKLDKTSVDAGGQLTATIGMNSTALSHKFTWKFGYASFTSEAAAGETSHAVTIPAEWMNQIPNATSGTATVTMQTYSGSTLIGTSSANFTVTVPANIVPTLAAFSVAGVNPFNSLVLKDVSSAKATLSGASGQYGAAISKVQLSGNGESATAYTLTTGVLKTAGNITFTAQVWDTRGRSATKTATLYVTDYSPPKITATTEFRCNSAGTAQRNGTYAKCAASWKISTLAGVTATLTISYARTSGTWSPDVGYQGQAASGSSHVVGSALDIRYGWTIIYTVTDGIATATTTARIPTAEHFLHLRKGGTGIGIGGMCEADNRVQIQDGWALYLGTQNVADMIAAAGNKDQGTLPIAKGGTGATTVAVARNNLGLGNTSGALPVANGGTGASTAADARTNLGITLANLGAAAASHNHAAGNITSGTIAAARLPFKVAYGSTSINGNSSISVSYSSAGFTSVPKVVACYSTTGANWSGDNGAIKIHSKTTSGFSIVVGGSFSSSRAVDWIAIGT